MAKLFGAGTNKQGLIVYNGETSADYGMVISEAPDFEKPSRKQTTFTVPGRSGVVLFQEDAWNDVTRKYRVWCPKSDRESLTDVANGLTAWLNSAKGYQRLEDSFEPDVFRLAYYSGGDDVENHIMQYGESDLTFTCRPERFLKIGENKIPIEAGNFNLYNPTKFDAKPLIYLASHHVFGAEMTLTIGGKTLVVGPTSYTTMIEAFIDCETMNVTRPDGTLANSSVSGEFLTIPGGQVSCSLTVEGTLDGAYIIPRYFTI